MPLHRWSHGKLQCICFRKCASVLLGQAWIAGTHLGLSIGANLPDKQLAVMAQTKQVVTQDQQLQDRTCMPPVASMPACSGTLNVTVELFVISGQASTASKFTLLQLCHLAKGSGLRLLGGCVIIAHAPAGTQRVGEICSGHTAPVRALADCNPGAHSREREVPLAGKRLNVVRKLQNT